MCIRDRYNVIWCTEYDEAGEILSRGKNKPDLLIFDVDIPKRREYETVEKIRIDVYKRQELN